MKGDFYAMFLLKNYKNIHFWFYIKITVIIQTECESFYLLIESPALEKNCAFCFSPLSLKLSDCEKKQESIVY